MLSVLPFLLTVPNYWVIAPFLYWFIGALYILGHLALICDTGCKYFPSICCLLTLHKMGFCHEGLFLMKLNLSILSSIVSEFYVMRDLEL